MNRHLLQTSRRFPGKPMMNVLIWWTFVPFVVRVALWLIWRFRTYEQRRIPREGPLIYVSNHQSHLDPMMLGIHTEDRPFCALARDTLFDHWLIGYLLRRISVIPLRRGSSDIEAMRTALEALKLGRCALVFPEGTRGEDGRIGEFKRGVMLLIKRSGADVIPMAVEGCCDAWPRGGSGPKYFRGRIASIAGDPIPAAELLRDGPDEGLARLRREIDVLRLELRGRIRERTGGKWPLPGPADAPSADPVAGDVDAATPDATPVDAPEAAPSAAADTETDVVPGADGDSASN